MNGNGSRRKTVPGLMTFALLASLVLPLAAVDREMLLFRSFEEVFSTSKRNESAAASPASLTVITADEIRALGLKTVNDVLRLLPGQQVFYTPRRSYAITRGIQESALVLLDGVSIMNPADGEMILDRDISLGQVKRIEVINSPGGILWGAYAFVGIINIITRDPADARGLAVTGEGGSFGTYGLETNYGAAGKDWGLYFFTSGYRTKEASLTNKELRAEPTKTFGYTGITQNSEDSYYQTFLKFKYRDFTLSGRLSDFTNYFQMNERGYITTPGNDNQEKAPVKEYLNLDYSHAFDAFTLRGKAFMVNRSVYLTSPEGYYVDGRIKWILDDFRGSQHGAEVSGVFDKFVRGNSLTLGSSYVSRNGGLGYYIDTVDPGAVTGGEADYTYLRMAHVSDSVFSLYASDTQKLFDKLTLSLGVRSDAMTSRADEVRDPNTDENPLINGGTASTKYNVLHTAENLVYNFLPRHYLKFMHSEGFRPPDWEQDYGPLGAASHGEQLNPEESTSYEVQYLHQLDAWGSSFYVNYARTTVRNLVAEVPISETMSVYRNSDKIDVDSYEAALRYNFLGGFGMLNYTHQYSRQNDVQLLEFPADIANAAVYYNTVGKLYNSLVLHYEGPRTALLFPAGYTGGFDPDAKVSRSVDGFIVANLGFTYQWSPDMKASLFVNNLLDQTYYSFGYLNVYRTVPLPYPGRSFAMELSYKFGM